MSNVEWGPHSQIIFQNIMSANKASALANAISVEGSLSSTDLKTVKGIGEKTLCLLVENGIDSVEKLKATPKEEIERIVVSPITRRQIADFIAS